MVCGKEFCNRLSNETRTSKQFQKKKKLWKIITMTDISCLMYSEGDHYCKFTAVQWSGGVHQTVLLIPLTLAPEGTLTNPAHYCSYFHLYLRTRFTNVLRRFYFTAAVEDGPTYQAESWL